MCGPRCPSRRSLRDLARLQSPSATVTGESDYNSSENTNSLVVRSHHLHRYGYEVLGTQAHLLSDSNADQAALTAGIGHDRCVCVSVGQAPALCNLRARL